MKRVASLQLPWFAIERLRRLNSSPSLPERSARQKLSANSDPRACSTPHSGGWRPGAHWARSDAADPASALPDHRQPLQRELGRRSETAEHPFKTHSGESTLVLAVPLSKPTMLLPPLILTGTVGQRQLVSAACPEAMALGLGVGMAATHARALHADLDVRPHDQKADARLLDKFALHAAIHWTPGAAAAPPDGLWLDLTGIAHLFGGEARFCERVVAFLCRLGFTARIAIADTYGAAHAVARLAGATISITPVGGAAQALALLPLTGLRLTDDALKAAHRFGFESVGDLMALPRAPLARRLGQATLDRLDQALGRTSEPIAPITPNTILAAERRLVEPIGTAEAISQVIQDLVNDLVAKLRERGLGARALRLTCRRVDDTDQLLTFGIAQATRDMEHLRRLLDFRVEQIEPRFGIEIMRLEAVRAEPLDATLLGAVLAGEPQVNDLPALLDQLAGRIGQRALFRSTAVESDVPERSVECCDPLADVKGWPSYPRPARLLHRPEPITQVVALLPDAPPRRFCWRGQTHRIVAGDGPERIHGEWWRRDNEAWAVRDYFRVEDEHGGRFWVFRRGDGSNSITGDLSWHMHGVFG